MPKFDQQLIKQFIGKAEKVLEDIFHKIFKKKHQRVNDTHKNDSEKFIYKNG